MSTLINPCLGSPTIAGLDLTYSTIPVPGLTATVVDTKVGNDFRFKGFIPGVGIIIDELANPGAITITATGAAQAYTYSTEVVPGVTATVVGTQVGQNFGFRPVAGFGDVTVNNTTVPGTLSIGSNVTYSTNPVPGVTATVVDTKVGSNFTFRGFIPGPNITLDQVSQPGAIVVSASGSTSQLFQNNTLFVDQQYGNNATGARERRDLPYQTLDAALAAALQNDTIHVFPGNYIGAYVINQQLTIYAENNVSFSTTGTNSIFTVSSPGTFSLAGYAAITVDQGQTGFLINVDTTSINIEFSRASVTGSLLTGNVLFNIVNFTGTLGVTMEYLLLNGGGDYCNINSPTNPNLKVITKVKRADIAGSLLTNSGPSSVLNVFEFYCDTIRYTGGGSLVNFTGGAGNIFLGGKFIEFLGATPNVPHFIVVDNTPNGTQSEISFRFEYEEVVYETSNLTLNIQSNKSGFRVPLAEFISKRTTHRDSGFNGALYQGTNADIIITSDVFEWTAVGNNFGFVVTGGLLSINCSTSFTQLGSVDPSNYIINSPNVYINSPIFETFGRLMSSNGYIESQELSINSDVSTLEGNWKLIGGDMTFRSAITLTANTNLSILAQRATFVNSGAISTTTATVNINCQELNFLADSGFMITDGGNSNIRVESNVINNVTSNITVGTRLYVRCSRYVKNSLNTNTVVLINSGPNTVAELNMDEINIANNSRLSAVASGTTLTLRSDRIITTSNVFLIRAISASFLNIFVGSLEAAPSGVIPGLFEFDQATVHMAINNILVSNSNMTQLIQNANASTIKLFVDHATLTSPIVSLPLGAGMLMRCGKCRSSANAPIITCDGLLEMSGNYTTNGLNVAVVSGSAITIGASKLVSTGPCITGSGTVYVIPSLASFAPTVVTVVGTIITNPGLPA